MTSDPSEVVSTFEGHLRESGRRPFERHELGLTVPYDGGEVDVSAFHVETGSIDQPGGEARRTVTLVGLSAVLVTNVVVTEALLTYVATESTPFQLHVATGDWTMYRDIAMGNELSTAEKGDVWQEYQMPADTPYEGFLLMLDLFIEAARDQTRCLPADV